MDNNEFDNYLKNHDYKFNSKKNEIGGYVYLKNNKNLIIFDTGSPPEKNFLRIINQLFHLNSSI